ncbi:MAG TPA: thioester domain-containing protein [Dermatophilaceae bacterium]|nr:thioester domain-containing protein [Dermatophilaceae bacterium]
MRSPRTTATSPPRRGHHLLAAGLAVGLTTLAVAPAAMAAEGYWSFTGNAKHDGDVTFTDGTSRAALLEIDLDGNKLDTYCIQRTVTTSAGDGKTEISWAESGIDNLDKVAWILHNSVPGGEDLAGLSAQVTAYAELNGMTLETDGIDMGRPSRGPRPRSGTSPTRRPSPEPMTATSQPSTRT